MKTYDEMAQSVFRRRDEYRARRKKSSRIAVTAALSLALFVGAGFGLTKHQAPVAVTEAPELQQSTAKSFAYTIVVNDMEQLMSADMDVQSASPKLAEFEQFTGMSYGDFTAKIPEKFTLTEFYSMASRGDGDGGYELHDYVFGFDVGSGHIKAALCSFEKPLCDCYVLSESPQTSTIGDTTLIIHGDDHSWFFAEFEHGGLFWDIEADGVTQDELTEFLTVICSM